MFLFTKLKWKYCDGAWFIITPMGQNKLCLIIDKLMLAFLHLKDKVMSNNTERDVKITRMEKTFVLRKYDMEIIGHKDPIFYKK